MTINLLWGHPDSLHPLTTKINYPIVHTSFLCHCHYGCSPIVACVFFCCFFVSLVVLKRIIYADNLKGG